jgi:shikimate kinase
MAVWNQHPAPRPSSQPTYAPVPGTYGASPQPTAVPAHEGSRVFLVGLMGAGKSTVGRLLATKLDWTYKDNDTLLQQQTGLDAPTLAGLGRQVLHAHESRQLRALLVAQPPFIAGIAASAADYRDDLALMSVAGHIIYLRATPTTLAQRVGRGEGRPWLRGNPAATLTQMFAIRDPIYQCVGHVVNTDGRNPGEIAMELADWLETR